jgi:hypothetical protein
MPLSFPKTAQFGCPRTCEKPVSSQKRPMSRSFPKRGIPLQSWGRPPGLRGSPWTRSSASSKLSKPTSNSVNLGKKLSNIGPKRLPHKSRRSLPSATSAVVEISSRRLSGAVPWAVPLDRSRRPRRLAGFGGRLQSSLLQKLLGYVTDLFVFSVHRVVHTPHSVVRNLAG